MRIKKTYIVLSFRTTLDAMEWEKQCLAEKVPGRLIPLPREISAGCGLAWRMLPEEFEQWQNRLDPARYDQAAAVEGRISGMVIFQNIWLDRKSVV